MVIDMKKFLSILLAVVFLMGCFSVTASAEDRIIAFGATRTIKLYNAGSSDYEKDLEDILSTDVLTSDFISNVKKAIANCQSEFEVTDYNIPATDTVFDALCNYLFYENPEIFNVSQIGCNYWVNSGNMAYLKFSYHDFADTAEEYNRCKYEMVSVADAMLKGIQDNSNLTDEQKLLLLHDRLAVWNEYGYSNTATSIESHTAYGALVNRISVCQGYAMAYMYLLDRIGIENYYCSSNTLNHGWNIVYLNGNKYHIDVTWDDVGWSEDANGVSGAVLHKNFLRSSNGIYATNHKAEDYDTTPTDTKYDNYFWQNSETEFQLIDNEIYYIDNKESALKRYSDKQTLCSVADSWKYYISLFNYYDWGNNSRLSSNGEVLLYSLADEIYMYNISTNSSVLVYDADLAGDFNIFGFTFKDGYLVCDINDIAPNTSLGYENMYRVLVPFAEPDPIPIGIEIAAKPDKKEYFTNEDLVADGLVVNLIYSDGSKTEITEEITISGFDSDTAGEKTITVTYGEFSDTFKVMVNEPVLTKVEIINYPFKETYFIGELLDINGLEVRLTYSDNSTQVINDGFIVSGFDANTLGEQIIKVSYCDFSDTFTVKVLQPVSVGDINNDGNINNRDLALLVQHINGWEVEIIADQADVNGDDKINNKDYALLMQYINGWTVILK